MYAKLCSGGCVTLAKFAWDHAWARPAVKRGRLWLSTPPGAIEYLRAQSNQGVAFALVTAVAEEGVAVMLTAQEQPRAAVNSLTPSICSLVLAGLRKPSLKVPKGSRRNPSHSLQQCHVGHCCLPHQRLPNALSAALSAGCPELAKARQIPHGWPDRRCNGAGARREGRLTAVFWESSALAAPEPAIPHLWLNADSCAGSEHWAAPALKCWAAWLQLCALDGHAHMPTPSELAQQQVHA